MTTKPRHSDRGPTRGAVVLFIIVGLFAGVWAIVQGFQRANDVRHIKQVAECNSRLFLDNIARTQALARLRDLDDAAQRKLNARWARDVVTQNVRDIPKAYDAFRAQVIRIDMERARLGSVITASTPPPGCKLRTVPSTPPTVPTLPTLTPTKPRKTATTSHAASSDNVPPLPQVVTVTETVAARTFTVPGPTVRVTVTVTRTVTRPPKPTPLRTCLPLPLRPCR